jgi:pilus assembly protein Flp/PilA
VNLHNIKVQIVNFLQSEDGPTAVEYAVMLALIVGACIATVHSMAQATRSNFDSSASAISDAGNP